MKCYCPWCSSKLDMGSAVTPGGREPENGDFSLCALCENYSIYENGALRKPNEAETAQIASEPEFGRMLEAVRRIKAKG